MEFLESSPKGPQIRFERGTLTLGLPKSDKVAKELPFLVWDDRIGAYRALAQEYRNLIRWFFKAQLPYQDLAAQYNKLELKMQSPHRPHDYQTEALARWERSKRGVCVLPTGSGKSFLAQMVIQSLGRSTLVLAPTIDLILQWQKNLEQAFGVRDLTVSTYDSARNLAPNLGNRFCLLVFDECHHLPSPGLAEMARSYIAPYRLGLTATPVAEPERIALSAELTGPVVYQQQIDQLSGSHLSPYKVVTLPVELDEEERDLLARGSASLSAAASPEELKAKEGEILQSKELIAKLRTVQATGRMVLEISSLETLRNSIYDIELENGDSLVIPENPRSLQTLGAVFNQTAFVFDPTKALPDYIELAGGYTESADKDRVFVLKVNGSAVKARESGLFLFSKAAYTTRNGKPLLEPGDSIVVPEKLERIAWLRETKDITQILFQIAVAAGVVIAIF